MNENLKNRLQEAATHAASIKDASVMLFVEKHGVRTKVIWRGAERQRLVTWGALERSSWNLIVFDIDLILKQFTVAEAQV